MSARPSPRGVDHVGITVPDLEAATSFFCEVLGAQVLHDNRTDKLYYSSPELEGILGLRAGAQLGPARMLILANGANIELFQFAAEDQRPPAAPNDLGLQHLALYVDDIDAIGARIVEHGGEPMTGPLPMPGPQAGEGNQFWYLRTPWGTMIELVTYPSPQAYTADTPLRRWTPEPLG